MKLVVLGMICVLLTVPLMAEASRGVEKTLTGCVMENIFYSVSPNSAHQIRVSKPVDLKPYEGKTVSIKGVLFPGDEFHIKDQEAVRIVSDTCNAPLRKSISRARAIRYRVQATTLAKKGNFDEALAAMGKAFEIDGSNCDAYTDRAQVYCLKKDFDAAAKDVMVIRTGACANPKNANYLLLEDLGKCLEENGRTREALEAYRLGYDGCAATGLDSTRQRLAEHVKRLQK